MSQGERRNLRLYMYFSQLPPLCFCQKSSTPNNNQGESTSEEESGQTKKINFYEMLDLLCFQEHNLDSKGA